MIYYFVMLLIPIVASFAWQQEGLKRDVCLATYFVLLLVFVGLRHEVGPDWDSYEWHYNVIRDLSWRDILEQREPGFFLINKLSALLGWGVYGVNFICAFLFLFGVFAYARKTANPWLAICAVVPYLVFIVGMSGVRQAAAIGLTFAMLASWRSTGTVFKLLLILGAMSIHSSAFLMIAFLVVRNDRYLLLRLLAVGVIAVVSASAIFESDTFARYNQAYIQTNVESAGAFAQVALSTFPALLYLIFYKKIRLRCGVNRQLELGVLMAIVALAMVPLSTTGVSRAALYLSFVQMFIYPAFAFATSTRLIGTISVVAVSLTVFFVYFIFGFHSHSYLPYQSVVG